MALRKIKIKSLNIIPNEGDSVGTDQKNFDRRLPFDKALFKASDGKLHQLSARLKFLPHVIHNCNLVHYYTDRIFPGNTLRNPDSTLFHNAFSGNVLQNLDCLLFHHYNIPMIISWAGGDVRIVSLARKNNPYFYREPDETRDRSIQSKLEAISKHVRYVATDPEMAEYCVPHFEKIFILPQPIDLTECYYQPPDINEKAPRVLHVPTHREVKGTKYIEAAVERLKSEGLSFDFKLLAPIFTQRQFREQIAKADVYVDELRCGSYGITAVEAMASGKPTLTYIREDLVEKYPGDLPLVNANPDTIYAKLKELILDAELRYEIGLKSRQYVEKHHALEVIGPRLLQIYKEIGLKD